jgi:hypothetical protein
MSIVQQGHAEAEGFKYEWAVKRDSRRAYVAEVFRRDERGRHQFSVSREIALRPAGRDAALRECEPLVPELLKTLRNFVKYS